MTVPQPVDALPSPARHLARLTAPGIDLGAGTDHLGTGGVVRDAGPDRIPQEDPA